MSDSLHRFFPRFPDKFPLPMLLDGSTGTALMRDGMPVGCCTEKWVSEHTDILRRIQKSYIDSGSDALYTPTFGANRPTLERGGIEDVMSINEKLAALTVGKARFTGGDMAPTGLFIEPFGDTPFDKIVEIYREQAAALDRAGVDFFISETNISLQEARAALIGIREVSDKPVFVTMTVDENGRTLSGDSLFCCLLALAELGVSAFGTNCSEGPDGMLDLLNELVPYSLALGIPLIAKPNAGLPHEEPDGTRHFDLSAKEFAEITPRFLESGIPILGGCCGTDAEYIRLMHKAIDQTAEKLDYSSFAKIDTSQIACTNRAAVEITPDKLTEPLVVDEDFFDKASAVEAEFIHAYLPNEKSADIFIEAAPMLSLPCAIKGDNIAIAKIRRYYNGKLLIV